MYEIKTLNKIATCGTDIFDKAKYTVSDNAENPTAIMVRSAKMHDMEMPESLLAIARAGAGVNNIPVEKCAEQGIVVFNTPGANSNAVKELAICALLLASRKITEAAAWAASLKGTPDAPKTVEAASLSSQVLRYWARHLALSVLVLSAERSQTQPLHLAWTLSAMTHSFQ